MRVWEACCGMHAAVLAGCRCGAASCYACSALQAAGNLGTGQHLSACLHAPASCRSCECLKGLGSYYRLAVPSTLMVCLEWWACESPPLAIACPLGYCLPPLGYLHGQHTVGKSLLLPRACASGC